jgi:hypothetical protein
MPVHLSASSARLVAKVCRDAALTAETRADRAGGKDTRMEYLATAKALQIIAAKFDEHSRTPAAER